MTVATKRRRNRKITSTTSATVPTSVSVTSCSAVAHRRRAIVDRRQHDRARHLLAQRRQRLAHGVDHAHRVRAGLAQHRQRDRVVAIEGGPGLERLDAVLDLCHVLQAHRVATAVGDDQFAELGGVAQLPVGLQRQRLARPVERADRRVDVGRAQRRAQLVQADVACRQRVGLHADAHGKTLLAEDVDLGHAFDRGQRRRDQVLGIVLQLRRGHRRRGQRDQEHRCVGRVDLAVRRRVRHVLRQRALGAQQRGLHVDGGRVDVATFLELECERGVAQCAGRQRQGLDEGVPAGRPRRGPPARGHGAPRRRGRRGAAERGDELPGPPAPAPTGRCRSSTSSSTCCTSTAGTCGR